MAKDLSHIHMPLSGGDRKALRKELARSRGVSNMLENASIEKRAAGEQLIREADDLSCQSWNERMWSEGGPAQPSPTIGQALNADYRWLEVLCTRCRKRLSVDLSIIKRPADTEIHQLENSLRHEACRRRGETPFTILKQLAKTQREPAE
jgi:hypothetical protein